MKGLLLKEMYLLLNYFKIPLAIYLLLGTVAALGGKSYSYVLFYPCMYASMLPISLLSYDEHHKWDQYCRVFPYSTFSIVGSKYLVGMILQGMSLGLTVAVRLLKTAVVGGFSAEELIAFVCMSVLISAVFLGFTLPIFFWLGVAKGRVVYYLAIIAGMVTASLMGGTFAIFFSPETLKTLAVRAPVLWLALPIAGMMLYGGSYLLSVVLYKKRYR